MQKTYVMLLLIVFLSLQINQAQTIEQIFVKKENLFMNSRALITMLCSSGIIYLGIMILLKKENTDLNELLFYKFFEVKNKNKFRIASGSFYLAMGVIYFLIGVGDLLENKIMIEVMRYFTIILLPILAINVLRLLSLRH